MTRASQPPGGLARLVELRVLDGPNRFFTRPAVKIEFGADDPEQARAAADTAADLVRRLSAEVGLRQPAVTVLGSSDGRRAIVAFPWRRRAASQAIASAAADVALGGRRWEDAVADLRVVAPGPLPSVPDPAIPVIAITGTNGKSTVTRLTAHIATQAGLRVGMTTSDGVYLHGELVEPGDWTGFGGAGHVLSAPGLDLAVLETARGGILLRGIGYRHNDVSVVTNISADHLGLHGVTTLEELADVKSSLVRITRPGGWAVLNGDDPLVWAMRRRTRAQLYAFSLDAASGPPERALRRGGRAAVLQDGWLLLRRGGEETPLVGAVDVPITLGGLSRYNIANALAAAAACDAIGIEPPAIAEGLRSFAQDSQRNPGRLNLYLLDGRLVIIDFAHNEAGLTGLLQVCRALAREHRVLLALGTAGDRTDEILRSLGRIAAEGSDEVVIAEKLHYLRGRDREEMNELFREALAEGGIDRTRVDVHPTELTALQALVARAQPGDVVAVMAHVERAEIFAWLQAAGGQPVGPEQLRKLLDRTADLTATEHAG